MQETVNGRYETIKNKHGENPDEQGSPNQLAQRIGLIIVNVADYCLSDSKLRRTKRYGQQTQDAEDGPNGSVVRWSQQAADDDVKEKVGYIDASGRDEKRYSASSKNARGEP